jgi:hypothetical protein
MLTTELLVQVAVQQGLMPSAGGALTLSQVLKMHLRRWLLGGSCAGVLPPLSPEQVAQGLLRFADTIRLRAGEELYAAGSEADALYIVLSGEVVCEWKADTFARCVQLLTACSDPAWCAELLRAGSVCCIVR